MVGRAKPAPKRTKPEGTIALVTEVEVAVAISDPETVPPTTPMPNPAIASQDIPTTLIVTKTLLLLTFRPQFDRTVTPVYSEPAKSSTSQRHHSFKLPFGAPSNTEAF